MTIRQLFYAATCTFLAASSAFAEGDSLAINLVSCVNTANGHSLPVDDAPWQPTQAILELPSEYERPLFVDGYYYISGKPVGHHGTWAALLDVSTDQWLAYETLPEDAQWVFASTTVPVQVVDALSSCGATWGGRWGDDYSAIWHPREDPIFIPASPIGLLDMGDLLPPPNIVPQD